MNVSRRGACPGLARPMLTGDGFLARLMLSSPVAIDAFATLCAAAQRHGNGILEITQRGSLQIRGLTANSAVEFAHAISSLQPDADTPPAVISSPLLGLDAQETLDLRTLVGEVRWQLRTRPYLSSLSPKVSVLIDSGGQMQLDCVPADIRVRATPDGGLQLALGGNAAQALHLGVVDPQDLMAVLDIALGWLSTHGVTARMRDALCRSQITALQALLSRRLAPAPAPGVRAPAHFIGQYPLNNGNVACRFGLAFGHTTAENLQQLARIAADCNVATIATAWDRTLLMIDMPPSTVRRLETAAAEAGLVTTPHDPRRHVVACAGAPACSSATWSTREFAPAVAAAAAPLLDGSVTIHLSGCSKGCAHPSPAAITLVGPDGLVVGGCASDTPCRKLSARHLIQNIHRAGEAQKRERHADEQSSDLFSRLGKARVIEWLAPEAS